MLYNLLYTFHTEYSWLNVFRYITFRSIGSAVTAFLMVMLVGPSFIAWLRRKQIGQVVRDDGPETHFSKRGVPTMGGMLILVAMIASSLLWCNLLSGLIWLLIGISVFYGAIGAADDWKKIRKGNARGLRPKEKLVLRCSAQALQVISSWRTCTTMAYLACPSSRGFIQTWVGGICPLRYW